MLEDRLSSCLMPFMMPARAFMSICRASTILLSSPAFCLLISTLRSKSLIEFITFLLVVAPSALGAFMPHMVEGAELGFGAIGGRLILNLVDSLVMFVQQAQSVQFSLDLAFADQLCAQTSA